MWIKNHYSRKIVHNLRDKLRQLGANATSMRTGGVPHLRSRTCHAILYTVLITIMKPVVCIGSCKLIALCDDRYRAPSPIIFMRYPTRARAIIRESLRRCTRSHRPSFLFKMQRNERLKMSFSICKLRYTLFAIYK